MSFSAQVIPTFKLPRLRRLRPPGTIYRPSADWIAVWLCTGYVTLCFILFFAFVQPQIAGTGQYILGADSAYYLSYTGVAQTAAPTEGVDALSFTGNFLGPIFAARLGGSPFGIFIVNLLIFATGIWALLTIPQIRKKYALFWILLNPYTATSIVTLNKEIFALQSGLLFAHYLYSRQRSKLILFLALAAALLSRWEQTAVMLLFLGAEASFSPFKRNPWLVVAGMVAAISAAYPILIASTGVNLDQFLQFAENGGTILVLNRLESHYGFALALIPKACMNLFGHFVNPTYFWTDYLKEDFFDIQNQYVKNIHTLLMLFLVIALAFKKRMSLQRPLVYFAALYLIITDVTPFIQPRYEYIVYIVLAVEISRHESISSETAPAPPQCATKACSYAR